MFRYKLRRVAVRLAQASGRLPSQTSIDGISIAGRLPDGGGSFGNVYKVELGGRDVAVRSIRVFISQCPKKRTKKKKVRVIQNV